jgi:hypothetical protein
MEPYLISWGAHGRDVTAPQTVPQLRKLGPIQFAHRFDYEDPEDVAHEASNFIKYATALGGSDLPPVLYVDDSGLEDPDKAHLWINAADWSSIVASGLHTTVETR